MRGWERNARAIRKDINIHVRRGTTPKHPKANGSMLRTRVKERQNLATTLLWADLFMYCITHR